MARFITLKYVFLPLPRTRQTWFTILLDTLIFAPVDSQRYMIIASPFSRDSAIAAALPRLRAYAATLERADDADILRRLSLICR